MLKKGDNLFEETDASGAAQVNIPGTQGVGGIRQGFLEASNVEPVTELIDLITTQRAFELNSQVVQAGDQIMQIVATCVVRSKQTLAEDARELLHANVP